MLKLSGWSRLNSGRTLRDRRQQPEPLPPCGELVDARGNGRHATVKSLTKPLPSWNTPGKSLQVLCAAADSLATERLPDLPPDEGRQEGSTDAEAGVPLAEASGAICVQRLDDSRNSAIHIKYRISLRSSSLREPRYPLLRVVHSVVLAAHCWTSQASAIQV